MSVSLRESRTAMTQSIRVLLVEDDEKVAESPSVGLAASEDPEYQVHHVRRLSDAVDQIQSGIPIDVVMLDLGLPDSTGVNTVMPLLDLEKRLPIVVFMGEEDDKLVDKLLSIGVQDYIVKGTETADKLQRSLRYSIERHRLLEKIRQERQDHQIELQSIHNGEVDTILGEEKRYQVFEEKNRLMAEVQRSNDELKQFAYIAAHDLQSPLRAVAGHCSLLDRKFKTLVGDAAVEHLQYVNDGVKRMQSLLDDLLQFSLVQSTTFVLEETDCNGVLDDVISILEGPIEKADACIQRGELPVVWADSDQLIRLFQHLVGNAVKYRNENPRVEVTAEKRPEHWVFAVRDNGIGIDPIYFDRIFDIFQRLHQRDEYSGTGIGLAICKKVVELHGGRIWIESEEGKGSTFFFTIPHEKEVSL